MRLLTTVTTRAEAQTLGDALYSDGIATTIKETRDESFAIWVHDEDQMERAKTFLENFDPNARRFAEMAKKARMQKRKEAQADEQLRARTARIHRQIEARQNMRIGAVTSILIAVSVIVFVFTDLGVNEAARNYFEVAEIRRIGNQLFYTTLPYTITRQPWRLITPIFLHGGGSVGMGFIHIGFNMWMLYIIGTAVERANSWWYMLLLVLVSAAFSNALQFALVGPRFGGMSGVVYALFGYIWIRGKYDPAFPYGVPQQVVTFLLAWMVLGFVGFMNMANWAHAGGLFVGVVWGFLASGYLGRKRRR